MPKFLCVNLPRWGLKLKFRKLDEVARVCVNLPRWGLKLILQNPIARIIRV